MCSRAYRLTHTFALLDIKPEVVYPRFMIRSYACIILQIRRCTIFFRLKLPLVIVTGLLILDSLTVDTRHFLSATRCDRSLITSRGFAKARQMTGPTALSDLTTGQKKVLSRTWADLCLSKLCHRGPDTCVMRAVSSKCDSFSASETQAWETTS